MALGVEVVVEGVLRADEDGSFVQVDMDACGDVQAASEIASHFEDECAATVVGDVVEGVLDGGGVQSPAVAFAPEEGGFVGCVVFAAGYGVVEFGDMVGSGG